MSRIILPEREKQIRDEILKKANLRYENWEITSSWIMIGIGITVLALGIVIMIVSLAGLGILLGALANPLGAIMQAPAIVGGFMLLGGTIAVTIGGTGLSDTSRYRKMIDNKINAAMELEKEGVFEDDIKAKKEGNAQQATNIQSKQILLQTQEKITINKLLSDDFIKDTSRSPEQKIDLLKEGYEKSNEHRLTAYDQYANNNKDPKFDKTVNVNKQLFLIEKGTELLNRLADEVGKLPIKKIEERKKYQNYILDKTKELQKALNDNPALSLGLIAPTSIGINRRECEDNLRKIQYRCQDLLKEDPKIKQFESTLTTLIKTLENSFSSDDDIINQVNNVSEQEKKLGGYDYKNDEDIVKLVSQEKNLIKKKITDSSPLKNLEGIKNHFTWLQKIPDEKKETEITKK